MPRQIVFTGRRIQVAQDSVPGAGGRLVPRDVILHPGAVAILPLVDAGHVCLVHNQRHAVGEELLEIPAGTLEPPELPEAAAPRELAEETGYRAGRWRKLAEFYPSPGILSERMFLFLAEELTAGPMDLDEGETIQPRVVAWEDAVKWALDGTIRDAKTLVALLLWDRLRNP